MQNIHDKNMKMRKNVVIEDLHAGYPICYKLQFLIYGTGRGMEINGTFRNVEVSPNLEDISIK